jgi:hypothetical protein
LVNAGNELENISPDGKTHPGVLVMYYEIYAKAKKWDMAAVVAEALVKILPDDPESWLNLALTERRKRGGSVEDAKEIHSVFDLYGDRKGRRWDLLKRNILRISEIPDD